MPDTLRFLGTGKPARPDTNIRPGKVQEKTRKAVMRTTVKSAKELSQMNTAGNKKTPEEIGRKAGRIAKSFRAGKIDITV